MEQDKVAAEAITDPRRVVLHMPVDVRSASLVLIATFLGIFALQWASAIFVPILMGLMFSYALAPVVNGLCRLGLPRPFAAALLLLGILSGVGWAGYTLRDDADSLIQSLPDTTRTVLNSVRGLRDQPETSLQKVQKAAAQLAQAAEAARDSAAASAVPKGVARVRIEAPAFNLQDYLLIGTVRLVEIAGQCAAVGLITYFLLASGDAFRRKLARVAGPTFRKRKVTIQALNEITQQVERYLLIQLAMSVAVGLATALAFTLVGLDHAAVWGVLAGVLNLIPYLGSIAVCAASALVALTQFGSIDKALLVVAVTIGLRTVSAYLVNPWLTSRTSRLNALAVFIGVLAWGWLWGVPGLLLGTPILMAVKAVCDRVDDLKPVGEFLGRNASD